jgi:SnoaL-like domain
LTPSTEPGQAFGNRPLGRLPVGNVAGHHQDLVIVGWPAETLERAASQLREGKVVAFERISECATPELAYIVEIERYHGKVGSSAAAPNAVRVTTVFRREDGEWRIVHRHADQITGPRPPESILQR